MKFLSLVLVALTMNVYAQTETPKESAPKAKGVESIVKEGKRDRSKKVEMCHDCGKPESECDCPEEVRAKEEKKKEE